MLPIFLVRRVREPAPGEMDVGWRRVLTAVAGVFGALALLVVTFAGNPSAPARAAADCGTSSAALDSEEAAFLALINQYRVANGLGALAISNSLNEAAAWMARDMGVNRYFDHKDSLGRDPTQRGAACGYGSGVGENIAAGTAWATAQAVFDAWKASPGHNANMLTSFYVVIGIARENVPGSPYGWYWATSFGTVADASPPLPPPPTSTPATATATPTQPPATATTSPTATATQPPAPTASPTPRSLALSPGANLVSWPNSTTSASAAFQGAAGISIVYAWDAANGAWQRYGPGLPPYVNSLQTVTEGQAFWVIASIPTSLPIGR